MQKMVEKQTKMGYNRATERITIKNMERKVLLWQKFFNISWLK